MPPQSLQPKSSLDLAPLEELAARALSSSRILTPQVLQYLLAQHEVKGSDVAAWLRERLEGLESYEQDLLLSPLFTPGFEDRIRFEDVLGERSIDGSEVEKLLERLAQRCLRLTLLHEGESVESPLPLVLLERYVRLLHIDSELPGDAIAPFRPLSAEVRCQLRDRAWQRSGTRDLLPTLLRAARSLGEDFSGYVRYLTDFVRTHRPLSREQCVAFLQNMARAYEEDLQSHQRGVRPFFDEELKGSYAGRRKVPEEVVAEHLDMISRARALLAALGAEQGP